MKTIDIIDDYRIIRKNGKLGLTYESTDMDTSGDDSQLIYKDVTVLEPRFDSLHISNRLSAWQFPYEKLVFMEQYGIAAFEVNCHTVEADGRHGLLHFGKIVPGLEYDAIFKMTYRHFLCKKGEDYTLYRFSNIGYESARSKNCFDEMATMTSAGVMTMEKFMMLLKREDKRVAGDVMDLISGRNASGRYASEYRYYSACLDDHEFAAAIEHVQLDDDFSVQPYYIQYGYILDDA